jgi:hypothetical protein
VFQDTSGHRARALRGESDSMVRLALRRVPASSSLYSQAQIRLADLLIKDDIRFDHNLIEQVAETIQQIGVEGVVVHQLAGRLFVAVIELIEKGTIKGTGGTLLGSPLKITDLPHEPLQAAYTVWSSRFRRAAALPQVSPLATNCPPT